MAAVAGMGIAIGPISGGLLIEHFAWSSVFLVNLPVVVCCLLAGAVLIPDSRDPESPRLDFPGIGLSIAGLTAVVWALIEAPERGWTSLPILTAFAAGTGIIAGFIAWELRARQPMLDVIVFRNLRFSAASISITFVFFALMGVMYFLTTYLQTVLGYSALETGVRVLPIAAGMILASKLSLPMTRILGTKLVVAAGLGTIAVVLVMVARFDVDTSYLEISAAVGMIGQGIGLAMSPATEAIIGALPRAKAGIGSAMTSSARSAAPSASQCSGASSQAATRPGWTTRWERCPSRPRTPRATASVPRMRSAQGSVARRGTRSSAWPTRSSWTPWPRRACWQPRPR